jgi:hypothetical protein
VLSFFFIFFLGKGLMRLWEKISPPPPKKELNYGSTIDVILGNLNARGIRASAAFPDSEDNEEDHEVNASPLTLNRDRSAGDHRPIPGQINKDMKSGLQDAGTKAEIVRKMGWGEEQ